jgi:hypothetical protein
MFPEDRMRSMMFRAWLALTLLVGSFTPAFAATGWLGIVTQPTDDDLRKGLDLTRDGLLVNQVMPTSPAATAGLKKGDVLLSLDGRAVTDPSDLRDRVRAMGPGRKVKAEVWRDGTTRTVEIAIGELPSDADVAPPSGEKPRVRVNLNGRELSGEELDRFLADPERIGGLDLRGMLESRGDDEAPRVRVHRDEDSSEKGFETRDRHLRVDVLREGDEDESSEDGTMRIRVRRDGDAPRERIVETPVGRGRLGVRIEPLSTDMAAALGSANTRGVLVLEVMPDTPALRAGFKAGDIVTKVGTTAVTSGEELVKALASVDGKVTVTVVRKGLRRDLVTDLGARPAPSMSSRDRDEREIRVEVQPRRREGRQNREPAPRVRVYEMRTGDGHGEDGADLRDEVDQLKQELRELRRRLEDKK